MMKLTSIFSNKYSRYAFFVGIVLFSIILWIRFTYPLFSHIDLSVSRQKAIDIATRYVESRAKLDINHFKRAVIFDTDSQTDRYLQKAIGFESGNKFLQEHHYDLFYWTIRFFNEGKKEEYRVVVSSRTGEVISLNHILEESTERKEISELEAQEKVRLFLEQTFHYDFRDWSIQSKSINKYDHRIEYLITWERKNIYVPWDADPKKGGAKLLTMATVTGDEIIGFSKQYFYVPDEFRRYIERKKESGRNLGLVSNMGSLAFMIGAIWMVVYRRNHLSMNSTKKFYIKIIGFLFLLSLLSACNNSQAYVFSYPTTQPYIPFLIRQALNEIMERFFFFMAFIIPCLAGELLRFEVNTKNVRMSFFHYISTTLFSRDVAKTILFGYCFAIVMIGLQTLVFEFGYNFCDVWVEQNRLSRFSTAFLPFFGILTLAFNASITEETFYRLFSYNFTYKISKSYLIAFLIPSLIWGLGHTGYMVFPFWFRGLEVTILGIFTTFVYLRFGIICVIVQHFVFDAFWAGSPYLFGKSVNVDFWMSVLVIALPLLFSVTAFLRNKPVIIKKIRWMLNKQQNYNLEVVKTYITAKSQDKSFTPDELRDQLLKNGWDVAVIDVAFKDLNITISSDSTCGEP